MHSCLYFCSKFFLKAVNDKCSFYSKTCTTSACCKVCMSTQNKNADFPEHLNRKSQATELPDLYIVFS